VQAQNVKIHLFLYPPLVVHHPSSRYVEKNHPFLLLLHFRRNFASCFQMMKTRSFEMVQMRQLLPDDSVQADIAVSDRLLDKQTNLLRSF
jgi:hypothetical protein